MPEDVGAADVEVGAVAGGVDGDDPLAVGGVGVVLDAGVGLG